MDREDLRRAVEDLAGDYDLELVYLFGSFARGDQHENSDIDVAVLFDEPGITKLLEFGRKLQQSVDTSREIDVRSLDTEDIVFKKKVVEEGESLFERSEDVRIEFETSTYNKYLDMKPHIDRYNEMRRERLAA